MRFTNSLYFKISIFVFVTQIAVMSLIGIIYFEDFSRQIDTGLHERLTIPAKLLEASGRSLTVVQNRDVVRAQVGENITDVFIINKSGTVVFSLRPEFSGKKIQDIPGFNPDWFNFSTQEAQFQEGVENGESYITSIAPVKGTTEGDVSLLVYSKAATAATVAQKQSVAQLIIIGTIITVLFTSVILFLLFVTQVFRRVDQVVRMLKAVAEGNLNVRITNIKSNDELTVLQREFNQMVERRASAEQTISTLNQNLQALNQELEKRVADRTRDLQVAADVSQRITTVLDESALLDQIVERTLEGFKLYYVSIFLYQENTKQLVLQQGTGDVGKTLKARGKQFDLLDKGTVPTAAQTRKAVVVGDVSQSDVHFFNDLLPETKSELALPMVIGDQLIGVLNLQSQEKDRFRPEDIRVLTTLSEQIAIAVQNARLFSEVQAARENAEKADQVKSAFLASMSHELRTPLNAIINLTKFVVKGVAGPITEPQSETLTRVVKSGEHLLSLINDVLDMSKIESGSLKLFVEEHLDVEEIVLQAVDHTKPLLSDKDVDMQVSVADGLPEITGDRKRLMQILINILSNACKFTEEGSIKVRASQQDDDLVIAVQDTGMGIDPAHAEAVFTPFEQTESGLRQSGGTGLGMPISRKFAEAHGGRLWFESELGKGSTFYVRLPLNVSVAVLREQVVN